MTKIDIYSLWNAKDVTQQMSSLKFYNLNTDWLRNIILIDAKVSISQIKRLFKWRFTAPLKFQLDKFLWVFISHVKWKPCINRVMIICKVLNKPNWIFDPIEEKKNCAKFWGYYDIVDFVGLVLSRHRFALGYKSFSMAISRVQFFFAWVICGSEIFYFRFL